MNMEEFTMESIVEFTKHLVIDILYLKVGPDKKIAQVGLVTSDKSNYVFDNGGIRKIDNPDIEAFFQEKCDEQDGLFSYSLLTKIVHHRMKHTGIGQTLEEMPRLQFQRHVGDLCDPVSPGQSFERVTIDAVKVVALYGAPINKVIQYSVISK